VSVIVQPQYIASGNAKGCFIYSFEVIEEGSPQSVDFTLQIPAIISNFRAGAMTYVPKIGTSGGYYSVGKNCLIFELQKYSANPAIRIIRSGDTTVGIHIDKLEEGIIAFGAVGQESGEVGTPYSSGNYTYEDSGDQVSKPIKFQVNPTTVLGLGK
jgi:hypothetical protein